jgi:hypothetical protein
MTPKDVENILSNANKSQNLNLSQTSEEKRSSKLLSGSQTPLMTSKAKKMIIDMKKDADDKQKRRT